MSGPLYVMKPNKFNALVPSFFKSLFYSAILVAVFFIASGALMSLGVLQYPFDNVFWSLVILAVLTAFPLLIRMIILLKTTYYFYSGHVSKEFKFFIIKKESVPYSQITNISIDISIWDRICRAGDVILHTAEDKKPDLRLPYMRRPREVERGIYNIMRGKTAPKPKKAAYHPRDRQSGHARRTAYRTKPLRR